MILLHLGTSQIGEPVYPSQWKSTWLARPSDSGQAQEWETAKDSWASGAVGAAVWVQSQPEYSGSDPKPTLPWHRKCGHGNSHVAARPRSTGPSHPAIQRQL